MQIGQLSLQIAANISGLQRGMEQAQKVVGAGAESIRRAAAKAREALASIGGDMDEKLPGVLQRTIPNAARVSEAVGAIPESFSRAGAAAAAAAGHIAKVGDAGSAAASSSERLASAVEKVGRYGAGLLALAKLGQFSGGALALADEFAGLSGRIALVSNSTEQATITQRRLFDVAQQTRSGLGATAELFTKLSTSTESLGLSQDRLLKVTRTIGQAMALSGGDAQSMNAAIVQLSQGLGSGALRGDELNSVIEQTPALAQAIAEGMGRTIGELRKLGADGKITGAAVVQALENMAGKVESDFSKLPMTVSQAMTQVNNALLQSVGVFDQSNGLSRDLAQGISALAQNMGTAVAVVGLLAGAMVGRLGGAMAAALQAMVAARAARIADTQATLAQAQADVARTGAALASARASAQQAAILGTAAAQKAAATAAEVAHTAALTAQTAAQTAATRAASMSAGVIGMLGGPVGIITTLLGAGVAAWMAWGSSSRKAEADAAGAVSRSTDTVVADLDLQIAKIKERNRLAAVVPNIAAVDTPAVEKLAGLQAKIDQLNSGSGFAAAMSAPERAANLAGYTLQFDELKAKLQEFNAEQAKAKAAAQQPARDSWMERYATDAQKLQAELKKAREDFGGVIPPDLEKRIRAKFAGAGKAASEGWQAGRDSAQEWARTFGDFAKMAEDAEAKSAGLSKGQARLLQYLSSPAYAQHTEQMRAMVLQQAYAVIAAEQLAEAEQAAAKWAEESAAANASHVEAMQAQTAKLQEQLAMQREANAAAGMSEQAQRALAAARLDEAAAAAEQRARWAEQSMLSPELVAQYGSQAAALRALAQARREADAIAQQQRDRETVDKFAGAGDTTDYAAGFDRGSAALGQFMGQFAKLIDLQEDYAKARRAAGDDQVQLARVEAAMLARQVNGWASMAGAAKGYFKAGSSGYKALEKAEKSFRAIEMAMAIKTAVQKLGLIEGVTVAKVAGDAQQAASAAASVGPEVAAAMAKGQANATAAVANQGNGDPYTAFFRIAAMAALMASIGFAVKGGSGGSGGDPTAGRQAANGTGTVLGDAAAKSESISKSIDRLADVDTMTMRYSAQMLSSLRAIEAAMAGVSVQILRAGGITTGANMGIETGVLSRNQGDPLLKAIGLDDMARNLPIIGGFIGKLQGLWGSTSRKITDAGLAIEGSVAELLAGRGVQQYADVRTTTSSWFGLSKDSRSSTEMQDVDAGLTRQFGLVFDQVSDSLEAAARAMGRDVGSVAAMLARHVISIPRLSLEGLSGSALQEALAAAIGAEADRMAKMVMPEVEAFQAIGEGLYETLIRVSSGLEVGTSALRDLGVRAIDYTRITAKQGDIAAELVRDSLVAAETTAVYSTEIRRVPDALRWMYNGASEITVRTVRDTVSGIGEIIGTLQGSAADLADAYRGLTSARQSLQLLGLDGDAVSRDLIAGAGGLDALQDALAAFEAGFYTEAERVAMQSARMAAEFQRLGVLMPVSSEGFRMLVRGIDATTAAGQELLGRVLSLSGAFADLQQARADLAAKDGDGAAEVVRTAADIAAERTRLERQLLDARGDTDAIRALELQALDESNRALQQRIWALQDETKRVQALASAGKAISAYIGELRGETGASASTDALRQTYQRTLQAAQGGDADASGRIVADARALLERVRATATDPVQVARESARIATQLQALPATQTWEQQQAEALAAVRGSTADMVDAVQPLQPLLERIADATEAAAEIKEAGQAVEPEITNGIIGAPILLPGNPYETPPGMGAAVKAGKLAAEQQQLADPPDGIAGESIKSIAMAQPVIVPLQQAAAQVQQPAEQQAEAADVMMSQAAALQPVIVPVQQAMQAVGEQDAAIAQTAGQVATEARGGWLQIAKRAIGSVPAYATGGDHLGGLRLVGEEGPELEVTGPSRIYSASRTAELLSGAQSGGAQVVAELQASRAELVALRAELAGLRDDQQRQAAAIAGATQTTARILTRITPDGDALSTREAEAI